ncbi:MAG: hypothetical protein IPH35_20315 [Rhodoferax sp.]|nr:hypothetical protein [Rhodoferax sp.]
MLTALEQPAPTFQDVWRSIQELAALAKEFERRIETLERSVRDLAPRCDGLDVVEPSTKVPVKAYGTLEERKRAKYAKIAEDIAATGCDFFEDMVPPEVVQLLQSLDGPAYATMGVNRGESEFYIDLLAVGEHILIAVGYCYDLTRVDVDMHVKRMEKFKRLLSAYRNHKAMGAVAARVISDDVRHYAVSQGLYVIEQNGEYADVTNPAGFKAREF